MKPKSNYRRILDQTRKFATHIGAGSRIQGSFSGEDDYIVSGTVEGDCDLEGTLVISEGGQWIGDIRATNVVIAGKVEGAITVTERLELLSTAQVRATLTGAQVAIDEGAVLDGEVRVNHGDVSYFTERRQRDGILAS